MKNTTKAALFGGALFCAGLAHADNTYRIEGPSSVAHPYSTGYAWDGAFMADFRAALEDPYNFSHFWSYVDTSIETYAFDALSVYTLYSADCIVSPYWNDASLNSYDLLVVAYHFLIDGKDLLLFNDSPNHDAIAAYFGVPTSYGQGFFTFNDSSFPFDGPFGSTASVNAGGFVGALNPADVAATGGEVLALDNTGRVVAAFWDDDDYAPGAGRMLIITDVDTVTTGNSFGTADYTPGALNDNGRFGLNLVAGLIGPDGCNDADCDKNGILNVDDVECFVDTFLGGCS